MDLTRPVVYRGLNLNDAAADTTGRLVGNLIEECDYGQVVAVGYTEKRAMDDGLDASDVFLSGRRITIRGTTYGATRADAYDRFHEVRAALVPTGAYLEEPAEQGYLPLAFEEETERLDQYPDGVRLLMIRARPMAGAGFRVNRDMTGGRDERGLGVAWTAALEAKDPRIYGQLDIERNLAHATSGETGLNFVNRGDYPSPLNFLIVVPISAGSGTFTITLGGSQTKVTVPNSTATQIIRYDGEKKVLTVEENSIERIRMDMLSFSSEATHPLVMPGTTSWSWSLTSGTLDIDANSRVWFAEAYA